jgi:hypothetical protein
MTENQEQRISWEGVIRTLLDRLEIPSGSELRELHKRLDKLEALVYQKAPERSKTKEKKEKSRKSASDVVFNIIAEFPEGTNFKTVKAKSGYDDKKLRNIIYRLDKIGRIEKVKRGVYKAV